MVSYGLNQMGNSAQRIPLFFMQLPDFTSFVSWLRRRKGLATVVLCASLVLAACGGGSDDSSADDADRRFVTDRPTASATIATTPTEVVVAAEPTAVPTVDAEQVLVPRGAPRFVYMVVNDELQAYDATARTFTSIVLPSGLTLLDYSPSPTGDRVGVLGLLDDDVIVQFYGADGEALGEAVVLTAKFPAATPAATPLASPVATPMSFQGSVLNIDWIPQGNAVLVSGPGVLQRVSMNSTVMPVSRTGATGSVTSAVWSPMDSQVVIQTRQANGDQAVYLLNSGHDEVTEIDVLHDTFGPSITHLQWLPSGLGLMVVAGTVQDDTVMNSQVYVYRFGEPVPVLVATSGQGGPSGTISHAVVSPDGQSVAYAIMVRDLDQWRLHSLWVRPLRGGPALSIPVTSNSPITALIWSSEGLVWQQGDGSLSVVDGDLEPRPLGEAPKASPVASPQAQPAGTPAASPVQQATPRG